MVNNKKYNQRIQQTTCLKIEKKVLGWLITTTKNGTLSCLPFVFCRRGVETRNQEVLRQKYSEKKAH